MELLCRHGPGVGRAPPCRHVPLPGLVGAGVTAAGPGGAAAAAAVTTASGVGPAPVLGALMACLGSRPCVAAQAVRRQGRRDGWCVCLVTECVMPSVLRCPAAADGRKGREGFK
eukprot:1160679-Pelagomonas_calceolata.AAC.12